jgi:hypothetical protein
LSSPASSARFLCSDPQAGDFEFDDVESLLDGLEAALVSPDTPLFDKVRQSWQPVAAHSEVRVAWANRLRYRPPDEVGLVLPALPSEKSLSDDEWAQRRQAFALARAGRSAEAHAEAPGVPRPRLAIAGALWALVVLLLVAWGIIAFAERLANFAADAAGVEKDGQTGGRADGQ